MRTKTIVMLAVLACMLAGCTAQKARALRNGAVQFKTEALAAVKLIDKTIDLEHAPEPRSRSGADSEFAKSIIDIMNNKGEITAEAVDFARDPYSVSVDPETEEAQQQLVTSLYEQYSAFGDAFTDLEQGFLFSADAVEAAGPTAKRLTAQLVVFANVWSKTPPRFIQRRAALLIRLENAAADEDLSTEQKRKLLFELNEDWGKLLDEEVAAQRTVVEQCLKAATIGRQVQGMIADFNNVSLEDIQNFVAFAFQQAGQLTGADFSSLSERSATLFKELRDDPVWSESIEIALANWPYTAAEDAPGNAAPAEPAPTETAPETPIESTTGQDGD